MSFSLCVVIAERAFKTNPAGNPWSSAGKCAFCKMHEQTWALGLHSCRALSSQLRDHL